MRKLINIENIGTKEHIDDIFTQPLSTNQLTVLWDEMMNWNSQKLWRIEMIVIKSQSHYSLVGMAYK